MPKRGVETQDPGVKRITRSTAKATKVKSDDIGVSITEISGKKAKLGGSKTSQAASSSKKAPRRSVRIKQSAAIKAEQIVPPPLKKAASKKVTKKRSLKSADDMKLKKNLSKKTNKKMASGSGVGNAGSIKTKGDPTATRTMHVGTTGAGLNARRVVPPIRLRFRRIASKATKKKPQNSFKTTNEEE